MEIFCPDSGSSGNLYKVGDGHTSILLECGLPIKEIRRSLNYNLYSVSACFLSHEHGDHSAAAWDILNGGIPLHTSPGTAKALGVEEHWGLETCRPGDTIFVGGSLVVKPFKTEHDAKEPLGFFIYSKETGERLLFATDTYYIRYLFPMVNYLMIECSYDEDILAERHDVSEYYIKRLRVSHLSFQMLKDYLEKMDTDYLKEVYLLHMSDGSSDEKLFVNEIQKITGVPVYAP
ncbi:MAG: MBL fold metallo-hydrolase [Clostridiales bacterium]|nr:MBL fold metallo-hydrolase [Clostridiales bacterium]